MHTCMPVQSYIDFEIAEGERERTRALYERLLDRTRHVKVWMSYAAFEAAPLPLPEDEDDVDAQRRAAQASAEAPASREVHARRCVPFLAALASACPLTKVHVILPQSHCHCFSLCILSYCQIVAMLQFMQLLPL